MPSKKASAAASKAATTTGAPKKATAAARAAAAAATTAASKRAAVDGRKKAKAVTGAEASTAKKRRAVQAELDKDEEDMGDIYAGQNTAGGINKKPTTNGAVSRTKSASEKNTKKELQQVAAPTARKARKLANSSAAPIKAAPKKTATAARKAAKAPDAGPGDGNGMDVDGGEAVNGIEPAAKSRASKRRRDEESRPEPAAKKLRVDVPAAPKPKYPARVKIGKKINSAPTQKLDIFVFGEGSSGELGLGSVAYDGGKQPIDVKRPRLNHNLKADKVGVVQIACGGMHVAALTHDNKILTWGVNDQGALGRDTEWEGGMRDMEDDDDSEAGDDTGMNPRESTPAAVGDEYFVPGTKFVQVVASDSATFALTEDGKVYGWGTFRVS